MEHHLRQMLQPQFAKKLKNNLRLKMGMGFLDRIKFAMGGSGGGEGGVQGPGVDS